MRGDERILVEARDALRALQRPGAVVCEERSTGAYVVKHDHGGNRVTRGSMEILRRAGVLLDDPVRLSPDWLEIMQEQPHEGVSS